MFVSRPSIPYFGFQRPMLPQPMQQAVPQQMQGMPPQMPGQPQAGMMPPGVQLGALQMNPQLLAHLAQLRGMGLGGVGGAQLPMFGRPSIQPIATGAYSLR